VATLEGRTLLTTPTLTTIGVAPRTPTYGQTETFTAHVTTDPPGAVVPTGGMVTFLDGAATLGSSPLVAGTATFPTAKFGAGPHAVTAVYGGDGVSFAGSSSGVAQVPIIRTAAAGANPGGPATAAALDDPHAVAVDAAGDLFIATKGAVLEVNHATGMISTIPTSVTDP
jgi:hypothetical protein